MPNCSHSSLTVKRALCANITNRMISSIGVTLFQDILSGSVTHHPGLFVTYLSGSNPRSSAGGSCSTLVCVRTYPFTFKASIRKRSLRVVNRPRGLVELG
jgi:hypothetical protein